MPAYALQRPYVAFTQYDAALAQEMKTLQTLKRSRSGLYAPDTIMRQGPNSTPFIETGSIAQPQLSPNTQYTLLRFTIPNGCMGVLKNRAHWVQGAGFQEGSGQLRWSVAIGDGWIFNEGSLLYSIGPDSLGEITASGGGLLLRPNVTITYYVTTSSQINLDPAAVILCRLRGWYQAT